MTVQEGENLRTKKPEDILRTTLEIEKQNIQKALDIKRKFKGSVVWEKVKCGKTGCRKCQNGAFHGPYSYLHFYFAGKVKRKYLPKVIGELAACPKNDLEERLKELEQEEGKSKS